MKYMKAAAAAAAAAVTLPAAFTHACSHTLGTISSCDDAHLRGRAPRYMTPFTALFFWHGSLYEVKSKSWWVMCLSLAWVNSWQVQVRDKWQQASVIAITGNV
jgi:hypothetical protein